MPEEIFFAGDYFPYFIYHQTVLQLFSPPISEKENQGGYTPRSPGQD